jgi:Mg2+-importing ATPase
MNAFWAVPADTLLERLATAPGGLSSEEARRRLDRSRGSRLQGRRKAGTLGLLLGQFKSPIILLLLLAAGLSLFLREATDAAIVLAIVLASGLLGFWQEHGAARAVDKLLALVRVGVRVLRDGV